MQFSSTDKSLYLKLVYYGPGLCGKTTNLETIHRLTDPRRRQPMVSLKTEGDRTLFFDLLPFDLGQISGLDVRLKLYTVPGQIQYDTTRKQVLAGADGVVFVADSGPRQRESNRVMIRYLRNNLIANGLDPEKLPLVFQWNKRDLPDAMPVRDMEEDLKFRGAPSIPSVATAGTGVMESFCELSIQVMEQLTHKATHLGDRLRKGDLRAKIESIFGGFIDSARKTAAFRPAAPIGRTVPEGPRACEDEPAPESHRPLGLDDLLSQAVETNLSFSERLVADASREQLVARTRRERQTILGLSRLALGGSEPAAIS
jgi:signal recognition particle receptor subunit beta